MQQLATIGVFLVKTRMDVLVELQNWGNRHREEVDTQETLLETLKQCTDIRKKAVEAFNGWVNGTIAVPSKQEREEQESKLNELARHVTEMCDSLIEINEYMEGWDITISNLQHIHGQFIELMYKNRKSLEDICVEMGISDLQAEKIHLQAINLLRAIG